jgi:hypothetical protein
MPDLKSQLIQVAPLLGISPKPAQERVWLWVKDHQWCSAKRVAADLQMGREVVNKLLVNLKYRAMVINRPSQSRTAHRNEVEWSVNEAMRGVYELLSPVYPTGKGRAKSKTKKPKAETVLVSAVEASKVPGIESTKPENVEMNSLIDVENLTLAQARDLWKYLNAYFGGR